MFGKQYKFKQYKMRNDKYKFFQPPRLKTVSKSKLNGTHRTMNVQAYEPIFADSNIYQFDQISFKSKYERALQLMSVNRQTQSRNALSILESLSNQIHMVPEQYCLGYDLLQKVVINCWRIKNSFKHAQIRKQQSLNFIKNEVQFFTELYKKRQVHKNGLHMLYLIEANEQFDERLYTDALKSCEMSIKYCSGIKNQPHLLKVQYLKSTIYAALNSHYEQLESIKKCMRFINSLTATTDQQPLKDFITQLKKNLIERQATLRERPVQPKSIDAQAKPSPSSLFRKRSLSQKKQSKKELTIQKQPQVKHVNRMKSIHTRSANLSKHSTAAIKQQKPTFLPVDLTKFTKTQPKLKKRPLKLQSKNRINEVNNSNQMDQIQCMQPPVFNFDLLLVRRPNQRRQQLKKSNKSAQIEQNRIKQVQIHQLSKKQSSQKQQQKIEPVTHYLAKSQQTPNDEVVEEQHEQLVRECVRVTQQIFFKTYLKKMAQEEELQQYEKMSSNPSNYNSKQQNLSQSSFSSSNQFRRLQQFPNILLTHSQSKNYFQISESEVQFDNNLNNNDSWQLVLYAGILSKFKFSVRLQKKEHENEVGQFYKEIYISFCALLNKRQILATTLTFRYYNPYQKNLQIIIEEVCKNELNNVFSGQSIKFKLLNLVSNRLLIVKKPNGFTIVQKQNHLPKSNHHIDSYVKHLKNYFIIYEENKLTDFSQYQDHKSEEYVQKKMKENAIRFRRGSNQQKNTKQDNYAFHQILNQYLPTLMKRMTDQLKEENSSASSLKRMRTEKFYKNTILSYQSLIKSLNESDLNARFTFEDQKSLTLVMPSDFNLKVSNFFENEQGVKQTTIYQFYYCMKFILIQPTRTKQINKPDQPPKQLRRRSSSIVNAVKELDQVKEISREKQTFDLPLYLQDTLVNFYDSIQISHLFYLKSKKKVNIKMKCYKVKQIFKRSEEQFYKFVIQFNGQKIKMMKFIATSYDINKLMHKKSSKGKENMLKSSRKIKQKINKEEYQAPPFNKKSLLIVLKQISSRIFIKKDYIYSMIGLQNSHSYFHYINKFKLQGKTVQNKQFMIPHLKVIHILLQKSIRINCDNFKEFAVLTIRQIQRTMQFNVIFYFPKFQRTFSVALTKNILDYLRLKDQLYLFDGQVATQQIKEILFKDHKDISLKQIQSKYWNNFSKLFKFQMHYFEDKMQMFLKIGSYVAFLKDSCFSEYFELKNKIFHLEMSLSKKPSSNSSQFELKHTRNIHPKRKSSSSKELIRRNNFLQISDMKSSGRVLKPSIRNKCSEQVGLFKKGEVFQKISKIYETQTNKYILYLSLTKVYDISNEQEQQQKETHKINFSFYLSDMINLLKESKKELITKEENIENEFNEEVFSFSILVRAMTVIKYKLINELRGFKQMDQIFQGQDTIKAQKQFKNNLIKTFCSQNENLYSLNSIKKLYKLQNNIFLINKNLMNSKRNVIVTTFYDEKAKKITFYLTNSNEHISKQKICWVKDMKFPWIQFYQKHQLFKISQRLYSFYKNILLFT